MSITQQQLAGYVRERAKREGVSLPEHDVRRIVRDVIYTPGATEEMVKRMAQQGVEMYVKQQRVEQARERECSPEIHKPDAELEDDDSSLGDTLTLAVDNCTKIQTVHLERFAAAYLKRTGIKPDEAVLVEQRDGQTTRWWFEKRTERDLMQRPDDPIPADVYTQLGALKKAVNDLSNAIYGKDEGDDV